METLLFIIIAVVILAVIVVAMGNKGDEQEQERKYREAINGRRDTVSVIPNVPSSSPKYDENRPLTENTLPFDLKGLYYRPEEAQRKAALLNIGAKLELRAEEGNAHDDYAVQVLTQSGTHIGYVPAYLSQHIRENLGFVSDCSVLGMSDDAIPYIQCEVTFSGKSSLYWNRYLSSPRTRAECLGRYPILVQKHIEFSDTVPAEELPVWRQLHEENPDDLFVGFKFICALHAAARYAELIDIVPDFSAKHEMSNSHYLQMLYHNSEQRYEQQQAEELRAMYQAKYDTANSLMKEGRHAEALDLFLVCMEGTYLIQNLPKNICKCYEALGRHEECVAFCRKMLKQKWLTENTQLTLRKYIAQ